jgi:hypothetical protein
MKTETMTMKATRLPVLRRATALGAAIITTISLKLRQEKLYALLDLDGRFAMPVLEEWEKEFIRHERMKLLSRNAH